MSNYAIDRNEDTGVLTCRVTGFLDDAAAAAFAADWRDAVLLTKRDFPAFKALFDNSRGHVFSPYAMKVLAEMARGTSSPGDRVAVLVSGGINRLQAKRSMSEGGEMFVSEEAALDWLNA